MYSRKLWTVYELTMFFLLKRPSETDTLTHICYRLVLQFVCGSAPPLFIIRRDRTSPGALRKHIQHPQLCYTFPWHFCYELGVEEMSAPASSDL